MTKDRLAAALRRAGLLLAGGGLLLLRGQAARGCAEGVRLCTQVLLPTLFPFFVVTALLTGVRGPAVRPGTMQPPSGPAAGDGVPLSRPCLCHRCPGGRDAGEFAGRRSAL